MCVWPAIVDAGDNTVCEGDMIVVTATSATCTQKVRDLIGNACVQARVFKASLAGTASPGIRRLHIIIGVCGCKSLPGGLAHSFEFPSSSGMCCLME